jgi:CheY-like chemotaxis protein
MALTTAAVLVVDDEEMVRRFMRRVLEGEGYRVLEASNGDEALSILQTFAIDLVVTDIRMPVMTGRDLGALIAQLPDPPHVVYASASDSPPGNADAAHHLVKPFTGEDLKRKVRAILEP